MTIHPLTLFRERSGLSRAAMAARLDVSEVTVWRWEHGKRSPRGEALRRLYALTKIPTAALLGVPESKGRE